MLLGPTTAWKPFLFVAIIFAKPEDSHAAAGPGITLEVDPDALWMNNMPIAMGFVDRDVPAEGAAIEIDTGRDAVIAGKTRKLPFYNPTRPG